MKVEPLYGLPVEEAGDTEGWSIVDGQPGDLLADAAAAELDRIEAGITAFQATLDALPSKIQAGRFALPRELFVSVSSSFYNSNYLRGSEAVVFTQQFDEPPAVVVLPNNADIPGFSIEATASNVTVSGFTARLAVSGGFTGTFVSRWIAMERTQ